MSVKTPIALALALALAIAIAIAAMRRSLWDGKLQGGGGSERCLCPAPQGTVATAVAVADGMTAQRVQRTVTLGATPTNQFICVGLAYQITASVSQGTGVSRTWSVVMPGRCPASRRSG